MLEPDGVDWLRVVVVLHQVGLGAAQVIQQHLVCAYECLSACMFEI